MAAASNVKFLAVLQPAVAVSTKKITAREQEVYDQALKRGGLPANYPELAKKLYAAVKEKAKGLALPKGTAYYDASDLFAGSDLEAFSDAFHLTDEGYRVAAKAIHAELVRDGLLDAGGGRVVASP